MAKIIGVSKFERLFREAAGLDVDKNDLARLNDFVRQKVYDLLLAAQATAKDNQRDVIQLHDLPLTLAVFNNSTLGMVKLEMLVDKLPDFGVDVPEVNYAAIAQAMGWHAIRVENPKDLEKAYAEALSHKGPSLVDIVTDPMALSIPPKITSDQVFGFATAMSRIVLNGGAGEAVAMGRSNLRNIPRSW